MIFALPLLYATFDYMYSVCPSIPTLLVLTSPLHFLYPKSRPILFILIQALLSLLAAILHLGNADFVADASGEKCTIANADAIVSVVAELLRCQPAAVSTALLTRKYKVQCLLF